MSGPTGQVGERSRVVGSARVVVVGGGISGLSAAWRLIEADPTLEVEVLEAGPRCGGVLQRAEVGGLALDLGAESMLARRPEALDLLREVGLAEDLVHPATARAALRVRGQLHPLPTGTLMGVPGSAAQVEGLLAAPDVERVRAEEGLEAPPLTHDVSVAEYVSARVGSAVVDRLVEPLLGGVYAGHATRLSLQATVPALWSHARRGGSLLAAVRAAAAARPADTAPVFAGIRGGIARLPDALVAQLTARGVTIVTGSAVTAVERRAPDGLGDPGGWVVDTARG
ncbi:MAG: protoporphyrinogen oxidase, partial [Janthinobacterium lividum]